MREAHYCGKKIFVYVDETRPRLQGMRLTAWELAQEGIDHAIIADNAAGYYMQQGKIDLVLTGADRIAANGDIANKIILKYVNPADEWLSAQVVKEDTTLQSWDGQIIEKSLDIKGVTNETQANELAEITLNTMRYTEDASGNRIKQTPLVLSFATTVKNAHLEVGDIITIQHDILNRDRKFMILSTETDQSGLIQVATREYCETHYKNSSGTYII